MSDNNEAEEATWGCLVVIALLASLFCCVYQAICRHELNLQFVLAPIAVFFLTYFLVNIINYACKKRD